MFDSFISLFSITSLSKLLLPWLLVHGTTILLVLVGAMIINRSSLVLVTRFVRRIVPTNKYDTAHVSELKREDTLIKIVVGTTNVLVWILAVLIILSEVGVNIGPLIAAAGVVGLAFGFGGQYLIKDLISGFFIILENQYRIGDVVSFDDTTSGLVEDITLRVTILRDLDGAVHHVPHGSIIRVANLSKQFARVNIDLGISYNANLEKVIQIINETGKELANDESWKNDILKPIQFERVDSFGDSAVMVKILGDTMPLRQWAVAGEFRKRIKIAFDQNDIEIPFPQRVIHTVKAK